MNVIAPGSLRTSLAAFRDRSTIVGVTPAAGAVFDNAASTVEGVTDTPVVAITPPTAILRRALRRSDGRRTRLRKSRGTRHLQMGSFVVGPVNRLYRYRTNDASCVMGFSNRSVLSGLCTVPCR